MKPTQEDVEQYLQHWVDCYQCGGEGELDDCPEDTCCCVNPPCCTTPCDICEGKGGWYLDDEEEAL